MIKEIISNMEEFFKNNVPKQSDIRFAIPSHRTKKWVTFEEFKNLILQGKGLNKLCEIYSKHLISFYSYLSQGKVLLTKEQFVEEYEKGASLEEIGRKYNIPREHITYLREFYGIKRKGSKYQKRLAKEIPLSQEAKDIIIGSLLGDGHICHGGYFSEKHSEKQIKYLEWKGNILKSIIAPKGYNFYYCIDKRSNNQLYSFSIRTIAHSFLYEMRNKFYIQENGIWRKIIPDNIEEMLNERVLAVWFMDDGHTSWGYRNGIKKYMRSRPYCKISTQSFSKSDVEKIQIILKNKWQLDSHITMIKPEINEQPVLKFNCDSAGKLINMLKPFATLDLMYKFDEENYTKTRNIILDKQSLANQFTKKHDNLFLN